MDERTTPYIRDLSKTYTKVNQMSYNYSTAFLSTTTKEQNIISCSNIIYTAEQQNTQYSATEL